MTDGRKGGFTGMDQETLRQIASLGGKTAHVLGKAHKWTSEEAAAAGRNGGLSAANKRRAARQSTSE